MKRKIFISGGAGFIASHIIESLHKKYDFIVYDNFHRNAIQFSSIIQNNKKIIFIKGDVLDPTLLEKSMKGCDIVIHCAAVAGIKSVGKDTNYTMKVNLIGSYNVLEAAVKNKIKRVINFSTSEVYGPFVYKGKESDLTTVGSTGIDRWCYSISKLASEHLAHTYKSKFTNIISVRPFNIFGPRQVGEGAIEQITHRAINNKPVIVYNDGMQIRSWCYIKDFVQAINLIVKKKELDSGVFNIGHPQNTITVLALAEKIIDLTNSKSKLIHRKYPGQEVEMRVPDISKAKKILGFNPVINLTKGLQETIRWYKQHNQASK